ncbi:AMP-binding protein [Thermodesulfobacteriota bacterium]
MGMHDFTFYNIIKRNARACKDGIALVCGDRRVTNDGLLELVDRLADGLVAAGLKTGDRIGVLAKNSLEFVYLYAAAAKTGALLLPVNWRLSAEEVAFVLSDGTPSFVFVDPEFESMVDAVQGANGFPSEFFSTGAVTSSLAAFNDIFTDARNESSADFSNRDAFVIMHTAAVQGKPRGAVLTHQGTILAAMNVMTKFRLSRTDGNIVMLPLFHSLGLVMLLAASMAGGLNIVMPKFDAAVALRHIKEDKATMFGEFAPMLGMLLDAARDAGGDLSGVRNVLGIDGPDTIERFQETAGATFWVAYGQSETSALCTTAPYSERPGSAGFPLDFAEVDTVDEHGNTCRPGDSGEIVVRGPLVFKGYWNLEQETEFTFRDGRHHTGDLGRIDEDGYLWFQGRAPEKELIKPGGENVYPVEVENTILEHPSVAAVSVIGVPDAKWGEAIKAVCVLEKGDSLDEKELIEFVAGRIARFKKPKHVVFVGELPLLESGGVDRDKVKAEHGG